MLALLSILRACASGYRGLSPAQYMLFPMDCRASIGHCTVLGSPVTVARIEESHAIYLKVRQSFPAFLWLLVSAAAVATTPMVTVTSPANNSQTTSPVNYLVNATSPTAPRESPPSKSIRLRKRSPTPSAAVRSTRILTFPPERTTQ